MPDDKLTTAARAALMPLGCFQRGSSRIWLDDRGWWVGVTRFHLGPSPRHNSFKTGACWLWREPSRYSIHDGMYVEDANASGSVANSETEVHLADRAAREVVRLRTYFNHARAAFDRARLKTRLTLLDHYDTIMACGLIRQVGLARRRMGMIEEQTTSDAVAFQKKVLWVKPLLDDPRAFQKSVLARIAIGRERLGLPRVSPSLKLDV